jgi:hypothetical protein
MPEIIKGEFMVVVNFKENLTENTDKHRYYTLTIKSVVICAICEQFQTNPLPNLSDDPV